jgi:hypothetical protein
MGTEEKTNKSKKHKTKRIPQPKNSAGVTIHAPCLRLQTITKG